MGGAAAGKPSSLGSSQNLIGGSGAGLGAMPGQDSGAPSGGMSSGHNLGLPTLGTGAQITDKMGLSQQLQQMLSGLIPSTGAPTGVPNSGSVAPGTNMNFGAPQQQLNQPAAQQFGQPTDGENVHPLLGILQQIFSQGAPKGGI